MGEIEQYLASGILERYVLGDLSPDEMRGVEEMASQHQQVQAELEALQEAMGGYARVFRKEPPPDLKAKILAAVDALPDEALKKKSMATPSGGHKQPLPELTESADLTFWQNIVKDIHPPADFENIHVHPLGMDAHKVTLAVWARHLIPEEVHTDTIEKFFILEGSTDCVIEGVVNPMKVGDYMAIPLHKNHYLTITSPEPAMAILQKVKAA